MTRARNKQEQVAFLSRENFVFILATALLARVVCMIILPWSWGLRNEWEFGQEIGKIGQSLADGHGFALMNVPTAKFPPMYPFLVGGAFIIFGAYSKAAAVILFLFQSICAAVTAVCLAVLGTRFLGRKEGIIAGFMWAFYPSSIFHSVRAIWYSELAVMLLLLLIIIAASTKPLPLSGRVACLGGLSGLLVLTDSTMALYPALLLLWVLYVWEVRFRKWIGLAVIWGVTAGVVVSPWAIRNWLVVGTPGILKSNFGLELFLGNNPYSSGGSIEKERLQALAALNQEEHAYHRGQPERAYYGYLQNEALEWIRTHPLMFLQLTAKRFWYFWGKFPSIGPDRWRRVSWLHFVWYGPLAVLSMYGFWYIIDRRWLLAPLWLFLLVYPLPYYVTHVQLYRYRYPVEPFIVLLAAVPLTVWFGRCWSLTSTKK
jgi:4-amino-4-deoxy-L-arabinose transferase-like glycosyltransferase